MIKRFLREVGITIDTANGPVTRSHRHHYEMLERLREPGNPYHEVLGCGDIHNWLEEAKRVRNNVRGRSSRSHRTELANWDRWTECIDKIQNALWMALGVMFSETKHEGVVYMRDKARELADKEKQQQETQEIP